MTAKEYIFKKLNGLLIKFPSIVFKYKHDKNDNTHIVSVEPIEEYEGNKEYMEAESDLAFDFENIYLPETIMFVSTNSLTNVNEPDEVFFAQSPQPILNYNFHFNLGNFESDYELGLAA